MSALRGGSDRRATQATMRTARPGRAVTTVAALRRRAEVAPATVLPGSSGIRRPVARLR